MSSTVKTRSAFENEINVNVNKDKKESIFLEFISPPRPQRFLLCDHESDVDFEKRVFAKKEYRAIYKRTRINYWLLEDEEETETKTQTTLRKQPKILEEVVKKNNLVIIKDDPVLEEFIKNY